MIKVSAIKCPSCLDTIYSRARHDMRWCTCQKTAIDGGQNDYIKISSNEPAAIEFITLELDTTLAELYEDWNHNINKYGLVKHKRGEQND